jgi:predicted DCC family thiol-disulfide oxidoreductase YuxK
VNAHDPGEKATVLFDGICNLCNGAVTFVIERDRKDVFRFAPLQGERARTLLAEHPGPVPDSMVLIQDGRIFMRSDAALRIARQLGGGYPLLYPLILLPRWIRDRVYDWVARNRYRWFGKRESCMIPTPELRRKFLDDL